MGLMTMADLELAPLVPCRGVSGERVFLTYLSDHWESHADATRARTRRAGIHRQRLYLTCG